MSNEYIVSARKYRPLSFGTMVGQSALTTTLRNAISSGKLAHAYLFCGPRGVGKTTSARIFAKTINCFSPLPSGDACCKCESCVSFDEQRSFNIHELDAASNNSVEDIRLLIDEVQIPPQVGKYKVFIIDEVHMLSSAAFNAFLKTLEEPPAHVIFILATTEKHKILPTILSRCQIYDFSRISDDDIVFHLRSVAEREGYETDDEALHVIAEKADGGMRDALSIFDQVAAFTQGHLLYDCVVEHLGVLNSSYYFDIVDKLLAKKIHETMLVINEIISRGFDGSQFMKGFASHLRNLMMSRDLQTLPLVKCSDVLREKFKIQANACTDRFIYSALKFCNQFDLGYRTSHNKRLLLEITLIQMAQYDEEGVAGRPAKCLNQIFGPSPISSNERPALSISIDNVNQNNQIILSHSNQKTAVSLPKRNENSQVLPRGSFGVSIKKINKKSVPVIQSVDQTPTETNNIVDDTSKESLTTETANSLWILFANSLQQDDLIMVNRMRNVQPSIAADGVWHVSIENVNLMSEWERIGNMLKQFVLKQNGYTIDIVFDTVETENTNVISRADQFSEMIVKNPFLSQLKEYFQLDFQ